MFKWFAAGAVAGSTAAMGADKLQQNPKPADAPIQKPLAPVASTSTALVPHNDGPGAMIPGANPGPIVDLLKRCLLAHGESWE